MTYGEDWDAASRTVLGPISRELAASRDAAGERYAVVLRERRRPQPVAVLHIAWADDYLGVWAYDNQGRRTRELDLRRLEPGRIFCRHIGQWRYDTEDMKEFADHAGRVLIDLYPDGKGGKISEPKGIGGGSLHTVADVPDEQRWLPISEFGDWGWAVALATGELVDDLTLRDAPGEPPHQDAPVRNQQNAHADGPTWSPPSPLRPRHLDEMFTCGTRFSPPDDHATGPYVVERVIDAGSLRLPTGRVVACDPGWTDPGEPFTVVVPPGSYRMQIATAAYPTEHWGKSLHMEDFTGARILVSDKPTVAWEMALRPGEDPRTLREGEFYGFGVDTGTGCFVDAVAADRLTGGENTVPDGDDSTDGILVLDDAESGGNLIVYPSGMGDGAYPVWIGRDTDGEVTCLVADMLILRRQELLHTAPSHSSPSPSRSGA
ncbi:DUF4241 domain-containing protein [Streptomyces sp. NPDC006385]|uniref:DUF4241 domain-containing protein n=1 Tax=Streptomyces sp. NPDC006385 TaxID=3156761 RepID=UPI0033A21605